MGVQYNPFCATVLAKWLWRKQCFACFSSTESVLLHGRELGPVVDCI